MTIFFSRDPGSTNVLATVFKEFDGNKEFWAKDYARDILKIKNINYKDFNNEVINRNLNGKDENIVNNWIKKLNKVEVIITGTTNLDDFTDRLIWKCSRKVNIETISILDQWIGIIERYQEDDQKYCPDYIISPQDKITQKLNKYNIPKKKVVTIGNPYLYEILSYKKKYSRTYLKNFIRNYFMKEFNNLIIYASEPFSILKNKYFKKNLKYDEKEIFYFIKKALIKSNLKDTLLVVKLHSKENPLTYKGLTKYIIKDELTPFEIISVADFVIGFNSMFLIESVIFEKKVASIDFYETKDEQLITNYFDLSYRICSEKDLTNFFNIKNKTIPNKDEICQKLNINKKNANKICSFIKNRTLSFNY